MDCQIWTVVRRDGPDHLGLWINYQAAHLERGRLQAQHRQGVVLVLLVLLVVVSKCGLRREVWP